MFLKLVQLKRISLMVADTLHPEGFVYTSRLMQGGADGLGVLIPALHALRAFCCAPLKAPSLIQL